MPYSIDVNGVMVRCDTAKELRQALEELGLLEEGSDAKTERRNVKTRKGHMSPKKDEEPHAAFLKGLKKPVRQFVKILSEAPDGVTNEELVVALGLRVKKSLGNIVGTFIRKARSSGLQPPDVLIVQRDRVDGKRVTTYKLSDAFLTLAVGELAKLKTPTKARPEIKG